MRKISFVLVIVALVGSSLACRTVVRDPSPGQFETVCERSIAGLYALTADLKLPDYFQQENPVKQGGEFDPNRYFEVLTHLKLQAGYTLDYVYSFQGIGGQPLLYARRVDDQPFQTAAELSAAKPASFLSAVETDGTLEGYLQLSLLAQLGPRFYQFWHAGYNDSQILCGSRAIERIISEKDQANFGSPLSLAQKLKARVIAEPGPVVTLQAERVTVSTVIFTNWGGFIRRTYTFAASFPHTILEVQNETLVEYNCGIVF